MNPSTQTSPLDRLLEPLTRSFSREAAQQLVDFRVDDETQVIIDQLADKANEGTLTEEERQTYGQYVEAIDLIAILQAKARKVLANG